MRTFSSQSVAWISSVCVWCLLSACGPNDATIKSYIITSPRKTVAIMPLSVAAGQSDVSGACERSLHDRLTSYGFTVVERPALDASMPLFGPRTATPEVRDVETYGQKAGSSVVLVGRIAQALPPKPGKEAVYRNQQRWTTDANGRRIPYTDQVLIHAQQNSIPASFDVDLRLMDSAKGQTLWRETASNNIPDVSLPEAASFACEAKASDLAEAYFNRKL